MSVSDELPTDLLNRDRRHRALMMRRAGRSYKDIAASIGYNDSKVAYWHVMQAMNDLEHDVSEEVRKLELLRLDGLLESWWPLATGNPDTGDLPEWRAADVVLKIMERRARLIGLDAPTKIAATNPDGTMEAAAVPLSDSERVLALGAIYERMGIKLSAPITIEAKPVNRLLSNGNGHNGHS